VKDVYILDISIHDFRDPESTENAINDFTRKWTFELQLVSTLKFFDEDGMSVIRHYFNRIKP
jgi:hypothetical protein